MLTGAIAALAMRRASSQARTSWHAANAAELEAALPSRALVGKERIETEIGTATGIVNDHGQIIAAVVLITAGYAADGKFSHYLLVQAPFMLGEQRLPAGAYVVGWTHSGDGLAVHIFEAVSGMEKVTVNAAPIPGPHRVESFHIWPPSDHSMIQIGRYFVPYALRG